MRLMRFVAAGSLAAASLGLVAAGATAADVGDGKLACNRYEICFSKDYPASKYQKHFYYGANHEGYVWTDTSNGYATNMAVRNSASAVANRDGSCDVKVVNDRGILPDSTITIGNVPDKVSWRYLDSINDANDRHERFNC